MRSEATGWPVIIMTFLAAAWLMLLPMPPAWLWCRPAWPVLVLVYWAIALPGQVGVGTAWLVGLCLDGMMGSVFGQQALSLSLVAWICSVIYQRIRMFSQLQQCLIVFVLVGLHQLIYHWLHNLRGTAVEGFWYLLPALVSAICWPPLYAVLSLVRRRLIPVPRL